MSKNLYLFRHGLATHSTTGYGNKIVSAEILPKGIKAIKKLAYFLKDIDTDINISSEFIRCRQTVKVIEDVTNKKFQFDKRLNEKYKEKFDDFKKRVISFLDNIIKINNKDIVICTHGIVIAAIKNLIINNKFDFEDRYDFPQTGELVIIKDNKFEKIDFNE